MKTANIIIITIIENTIVSGRTRLLSDFSEGEFRNSSSVKDEEDVGGSCNSDDDF